MQEMISTHYSNDQVSLLDSLTIFWQKKWWIFITTLSCIGISAIYLFISQPIYEANVTVTVPRTTDLSMFDAGSFKNGVTIDNVFLIVKDAMYSNAIKQHLFKHVYLPSLSEKQIMTNSRDKLYNSYTNMIHINEVANPLIGYPANKITISMITDSPVKSKKWLEEYLALVEQKAMIGLSQFIDNRNAVLAKKINLLKEVEENKQIDRMNQLKNSLVVAKAEGMQNISINFPEKTQFDLRVMESEYNYFKNIQLTRDGVKMFRLDGSINASDIPIKPRPKRLLILSILMGLILGCTLVVLINALQQKKIKFKVNE